MFQTKEHRALANKMMKDEYGTSSLFELFGILDSNGMVV